MLRILWFFDIIKILALSEIAFGFLIAIQWKYAFSIKLFFIAYILLRNISLIYMLYINYQNAFQSKESNGKLVGQYADACNTEF